MRLRFKTNLVIGVIIISLLGIFQGAQAYRSLPNNPEYQKLPNSVSSITYYYNQIDNQLAILNSGQFIRHAINQWNMASWYTMFTTGNGNLSVPSGNTKMIRAVWFNVTWFSTSCGNLISVPPQTVAVGCPKDIAVFLSSAYNWEWNTSGQTGESPNWRLGCTCYPTRQDLLNIMVHELGHVWGLAHPNATPTNPPTTVMISGQFDQTLNEDDMRAATHYYGPDTSFESSVTLSWFPNYTYTEPQGHSNLLSHKKSTSGNLTVQPYESAVGVQPYNGSKHLKLYGNATDNYSYVYYKLFTADDDEVYSDFRYLQLTNNAKLSWWQYNHTQNKMTVDILFTDGTTLRDSGLFDRNNICVHPACRASYSTGLWYYLEVNLATLQGKTIKDIMIAYDNGGNGPQGVFRAYFDKLSITY